MVKTTSFPFQVILPPIWWPYLRCPEFLFWYFPDVPVKDGKGRGFDHFYRSFKIFLKFSI